MSSNQKPITAQTDADAFARPSIHRLARAQPGHITKPAGAMNSAFDTGRPARAPLPAIDVSAISIVSGRPVAPMRTGRPRTHPMAELLNRMKPGDMVELPRPHAKALQSQAKRARKSMALRTLENGQVGVWLLPAKPAN